MLLKDKSDQELNMLEAKTKDALRGVQSEVDFLQNRLRDIKHEREGRFNSKQIEMFTHDV